MPQRQRQLLFTAGITQRAAELIEAVEQGLIARQQLLLQLRQALPVAGQGVFERLLQGGGHAFLLASRGLRPVLFGAGQSTGPDVRLLLDEAEPAPPANRAA